VPHISKCCSASAQDLLQPRAVELGLRESPEGAIEVPGLREVEVCSLEDCLGLLQLGDRNRCALQAQLTVATAHRATEVGVNALLWQASRFVISVRMR